MLPLGLALVLAVRVSFRVYLISVYFVSAKPVAAGIDLDGGKEDTQCTTAYLKNKQAKKENNKIKPKNKQVTKIKQSESLKNIASSEENKPKGFWFQLQLYKNTWALAQQPWIWKAVSVY